MTYLFVVAQLNMPTMTAPLSHGKQGPREEAHTSHARPATPPPTPQLLYSLRATKEGRFSGRLESSDANQYQSHPFQRS